MPNRCKKLTKSLCDMSASCEWVTRNGCRGKTDVVVEKPLPSTPVAAPKKAVAPPKKKAVAPKKKAASPKKDSCTKQKKPKCESLPKCEWVTRNGCRKSILL